MPEASRDREWQCQTGSMEREEPEGTLGYREGVGGGVHLMEYGTRFLEGKTAGDGHRGLPKRPVNPFM